MGKYVFAAMVPVLFLGCGQEQGDRAATPAQEARRERPEAKQNGAPAEPRSREETPRRQVSRPDLPAGSIVQVRLDQPLDSSGNKPGDRFAATLDAPVTAGGNTVLPRGTRFNGTVVAADSSGRLSGRGELTVRLDSFTLNGRTHRVETTTISKVTEGHGKRNAIIIGGGSAAGAAIGGIAGGGRGAAIGAGAGAAAGAAGAAATGKRVVRLPAETVLVFTVQQPVKL
jgi:hypothetical protein